MSKTFKDILNDLLSPEQKATLKVELNALPQVPVVAPTPAPVVDVVAPATFGEAKLMDGTVIKYDTEVLAVGSTVTVVTESGELPAPNGEHELENGDKIYITDGKVDKIETKAMDVPVVPVAQEAAPVTNPLVDALKALMDGKFEAHAKEVNDLKAVVAEQTKALQAFQSFFNNLVDIPTGEPVIKEEGFMSKKTQGVRSFLKK